MPGTVGTAAAEDDDAVTVGGQATIYVGDELGQPSQWANPVDDYIGEGEIQGQGENKQTFKGVPGTWANAWQRGPFYGN
ncbi:MAG: hypothetical protein U5N53_22915 [Mycobacterium sp.]|nr:hypothetical protein [Mycobacterium sp.]